MEVGWADNSVKNPRNLPINNPQKYLHNINAHTKFDENTSFLHKLSSRNEGRMTDRHMYVRETIIPATIIW